MSHLIEYEESSGLVREVFDDIRATRQTDEINNFWKACKQQRKSAAPGGGKSGVNV